MARSLLNKGLGAQIRANFVGGMMDILVSEEAAAACPTLVSWISGTGMNCRVGAIGLPPHRNCRRILHVGERAQAVQHDILLDIRDGAPALVWPSVGQPVSVAFGFEDMAFGHALLAELVRPGHRPSCGEPGSAKLLGLGQRVAASGATVLVLGETGTGKEGLARFIHAMSPRADKPFVPVNCAALPESMLEAMLFGHQKGSFTGAGSASEGLFRAAEGGTLMLDEIAELPLALQAKLLRALQEREVLPVGATRAIPVDVRVIAAANRDLPAEVAAGNFRADLYWRLNVLPLALAPLRARRQDVRAIAAALLVRHAARSETFPWPTTAALDRLMAHDWPGNVRELENVLQRALLMRDGDRLEADDLAIDTMMPADDVPADDMIVAHITEAAPPRFSEIGRSSQSRAIRDALALTSGHRARAAEQLGISERTLRYRLAEMREAA